MLRKYCYYSRKARLYFAIYFNEFKAACNKIYIGIEPDNVD